MARTDAVPRFRPVGASLHLLPIAMRVPLKFGRETSREVTLARACVRVEDASGRGAEGWGETPLSVSWVWPEAMGYAERLATLVDFSRRLAAAWAEFDVSGHPLEVGVAFQRDVLGPLHAEFQRRPQAASRLPWLAALVCNSAFDLALHDAYGRAVGRSVYETYGADFLGSDLASLYAVGAEGAETGDGRDFRGARPDAFLRPRPRRLPAWHLVGGVDPLSAADLTGEEPDDGHPVLLRDWIRRDGLHCLKVKLRGTDLAWDVERLLEVGRVALEEGCDWLSADFNCTVTEPEYVLEALDRLRLRDPRIFRMLLYVEQPFPYDLERHRIDVRAIASRKLLFLDESAHDWRLVRLGRQLGWTGVALKTCKTQSGAVLSLCWARARRLAIMVQDLSNPALAQIPHVLLAAHAGTLMGVETNSMQYYPEASRPEAAVHPGLYTRRDGCVELSSIRGPGFGYRLEEMARPLPPAEAAHGRLAAVRA